MRSEPGHFNMEAQDVEQSKSLFRVTAGPAPGCGGRPAVEPGTGRWRRGATVALAGLLLAGCLADEPIQRPTPLFDSAPFEFPVELWDRGVEGETVLMLHITETGGVDSVYVETSSGHAQFDSAAVAGAHLLRFTPGRKGEKRVSVWAKLPVRFTRAGAGGGQLESVRQAERPPEP